MKEKTGICTASNHNHGVPVTLQAIYLMIMEIETERGCYRIELVCRRTKTTA